MSDFDEEDLASFVYYIAYIGTGSTKGGVRFVVTIDGSADIIDSGKHRIKEIEKRYIRDKLITIEDRNLGNLKKHIEDGVKNAQAEGYGKTFELSIFGHGSTDGPVGKYDPNNELDLSKETGNVEDRGQLQPSAWANIDYNFDPENSVAAFYGCGTQPWAEKFIDLTNVQHAGGIGGKAGGTYNKSGEFNNTVINIFFSQNNVYLRSATDGKVDPVIYCTRRVYETIGGEKFLKEHESYNNLTVPSK